MQAPPPRENHHTRLTRRDESNQPENPINLQQFWFSDQGYFLFQIFGDHGAQVGEIMNHIGPTQGVVKIGGDDRTKWQFVEQQLCMTSHPI